VGLKGRVKKVKKGFKTFFVPGLLAVLLISSTACSSTKGANTNASDTSSKITLQMATQIDSLDPAQAGETSAINVLANLDEGLYTIDNNNTPQLAMAGKVAKENGGKTLVFTIRDGAKWSNGDPVTANDFVYAWRRVADPKTASVQNYEMSEAQIKNADDIIAGKKDPSTLGVTAKDDKTLVVELNKPTPFLPSMLAFTSFAPLDEKFVEKQGKDFAMSSKNLLANGPYVLQDWNNGDNTATLVKNKNYYDKQNVKVNTVEFKLISDTQKALMAYKTKDIDYAELSGDLVSQYENDKEFQQSPGVFNWYLVFNTSLKQLQNEDLRKAIAYSIDYKELTTNVLKDGSTPAKSILPSGFTNFNGKDFTESTTNPYVYNPSLAKTYWEKAKSQVSSPTFTLIYGKDEDNMGNVAAYIKAELEKNLPGIKVNLQTMLKKTRLAKMQTHDFQIALTRWAPDYSDPTAILNLFAPGVDDFSAWTNKDFSSLLQQSSSTLANDTSARWDALVKAEGILMDSATSIPLYQTANDALVRSNIHGLVYHPNGVPFFLKYVYTK
jgi:oligopeptide transport system substrate-binding protein